MGRDAVAVKHGDDEFDRALERNAVALRDVNRPDIFTRSQRGTQYLFAIEQRSPRSHAIRRVGMRPHQDGFRAADGWTIKQEAQMAGDAEPAGRP